MQTDHALGVRDDVGELLDAQRRGVRRKQRVRRQRIRQRNEDIAL